MTFWTYLFGSSAARALKPELQLQIKYYNKSNMHQVDTREPNPNFTCFDNVMFEIRNRGRYLKRNPAFSCVPSLLKN